MAEDKNFLTTDELATRGNMSTDTLEKWRYEGRGVAYTKLGSVVRYNMDDIKNYETERKISSE